MAASIWDQFKREGEDSGDGYFLRNVDFTDVPRQFKLVGIEWREQKTDTPEIFKTPDGKEMFISLEETVDGAPVKRAYTAKGNKNALVKALMAAGVETGDSFEATRSGEGVVTRFAVTKMVDGSQVEVAPF